MILAAPLVIPFAEAVGLSVATLGMAKAADMVNEYIQENPEQSMKILSTIVPGVGIGEIFMKKGKDEEVEEDIEVEDVDARDLTKKEKAKKMKELAKSGASREKMIKGYEEIILPGKEDEMLDEAEDRYEGGVEEVSKPKFDYKKFFKKRYADGGSIGIEVLFEPKRKDFNIGGNVQKNQPYDARASIMDYATALDKVGAGTQAQKSQSLTDYGKNILAGLDTSKLNPATRSLAASYGVGQPITKFDQLGQGVGQALQGAIMQTLKDPRSSGISLTNIPVSSYTSYFKDRGAANTAGLYDTGYNSMLDQAKDMTAALAGDVSAIARTTAGRFNVDIDPEARTGLIRDRYDFSKQMPGSTPYDINIALPQKFVDEILNSPEYQKITGYKPTQTRTPLNESDFYSQFYGVPYQGFENKYFQTLKKEDPYYDEVRRSSSAGSFSDLVDRGIVQAYTGPTDYKNYLSTFADGGRVNFSNGGAQFLSGGNISPGTDVRGNVRNDNPFTGGGGGDGPPPVIIPKDNTPEPITFNEVTGKKMLPADLAIQKQFLNLVKNKGYESGLDTEADDLYAAYRAATGLDKFNQNVLVDSTTNILDKEKDGVFEKFVDRNTTFKDLDTGKSTKQLMVETPTRLIQRTVRPSGIMENYGVQPFGAPQSLSVDPYSNFADGGRVGLFMGGDPLTGQALAIYNSMNAYGFSDQEIANALTAQGLYGVDNNTNNQVTTVQDVINQNANPSGSKLERALLNPPGKLKEQYKAQLNSPINNAIYDFKENMTTKLSDPTTKIGKLGINTKKILGSAIGAVAGIPGLGFILDALGSDSKFDRGAIRELNAPMQLGIYNKDRTGTGYFTQGPIQPGISSLSDTYKSGLTDGQFAGVTVDDLGRIQQTGDYNTAENVMAGYNAGFDLGATAFDRYDKIDDTLEDMNPTDPRYQRLRERQKALTDFALANAAAQKAAKQAAIDRAIARGNKEAEERARVKSITAGYGGWDESPGATGPAAAGAGMGIGGGYASDYGFLKDGGLATMFKEKR